MTVAVGWGLRRTLRTYIGEPASGDHKRSDDVMEDFKDLLGVLGLFAPEKRDILGELPPEISSLILRKLDDSSLLNAALVSRTWLGRCASDPVLRDRARKHIAAQDPWGTFDREATKRGRLTQRVHSVNAPACAAHRSYRRRHVAEAFDCAGPHTAGGAVRRMPPTGAKRSFATNRRI